MFMYLLVSIALGCTKESSSDQPNLAKRYASVYDHIDLTKSSDTILPISSVVDITNVVRLDDPSSGIIGKISRVVCIEEHDMFVIGDYKNAQVSIFSNSGRHIKSIGTIGKGPGEWLSVESVDYDSISNSIVIFSQQGVRINRYSPEGIWKEDMDLPFFAREMYALSDSGYVFFMAYNMNENSQYYNCLIMDNDLNIIQRYLPYAAYSSASDKKYPMENGFAIPTNHEVLMNEPFNDTIFSLSLKNYEVSPKYTFFFGDRSVPDEFKGNLDYIMSGKLLEKAFLMNALYQDDDILLFSVFWDRRIRGWIWDRKRKKLFTEESFSFTEQTFDEPLLSDMFLLPVGTTSKGECITVIYPHQVIPDLSEVGSRWHKVATVANKYFEANFPLLHEKILGLDENSNPLLVTYRLNIR